MDIKTTLDVILATVGVITLVFLTWQTILLNRQTKIANDQAKLANKNAKVQAYQTRYQLYLEMDKVVIDNPALRKLIGNKKYIDDCSNNLISTIKAKEIAFAEMVLNISQLSFYQYKDDTYNEELGWVKELAENDFIIEYWNSGYKCKYRADFEVFFNKHVPKTS